MVGLDTQILWILEHFGYTIFRADVPYPVQMEPNLVIEFYSR